MVDEYPSIARQVDRDRADYDGRFESVMMVCVESYIGAEDGTQGIKLEVVLTENGCASLTGCAFETDWI
ncbi:hypothetical protein [Paraburkholderia sp. J10-1]|uniref:hypothetical protein n=1 Tax=Paraburkholderia sp. J10-1 TaxID=2805430 RepID=UPI002AB7CA72|nr:hypothetical protein [Paraburkholderia sp. J10-1]